MIITLIAQVSSHSVPDWFYTNAPAAWISAFVAAITCAILLWTRKKPNRIIIREEINTSLISIRKAFIEKIKVSYENRNIGSLGQVALTVYNEGSDVIRYPTFTLNFPERSTVLEMWVDPEEVNDTYVIQGNKTTIKLRYLNPIRDHKQKVIILFAIDGKTNPVTTNGSGEGWSIKYIPLPTAKQNTTRTFIVMFIVGLISYIYGRCIERVYGIPIEEISGRAFIAYLPFMLAIIIAIVLINAWLKQRIQFGQTSKPFLESK